MKTKKENQLWKDSSFVQPFDSSDKDKLATFQMKHDEEMDFNCKKCNAKISAHNKDWHDRMCDECFDKKYFD